MFERLGGRDIPGDDSGIVPVADSSPIEQAAEALWRENHLPHHPLRTFPYERLIEPTKEDLRRLAESAVTAYLDALLRDLPEQAVQAAIGRLLLSDEWMADRLRAFLSDLRERPGR